MDFKAFVSELAGAPGVLQDAIGKAGDETARELRDKMKSDAQRSRHFKFVGRITSERTKRGPAAHEWEVGPLKGGAGSLAHLAYFGGANGGGRSIRDPQQALDEVTPGFEAAMADAIEKAFRG